MAEYIERDVLLKAVEKMDRLDKETKTKYEYNKEGYILPLKTAPTIEAKPVVHAHWKEFGISKEGIDYICSECAFTISADEYPKNAHYCPWCGAQMDGKEK